MRRIALIGFLCSICFISSFEAKSQFPRAIAPTLAVAMVIGGVGFVADLILVIAVGDVAVMPMLAVDRHKIDSATGLQAGALIANIGAGFTAGFAMGTAMRGAIDGFSRTAAVALPIGGVLTSVAAIMNGFAGQQLDSIVGTTTAQHDKTHTLAIVDYVFAGIATVNLIPFLATAVVTILEYKKSQVSPPGE